MTKKPLIVKNGEVMLNIPNNDFSYYKQIGRIELPIFLKRGKFHLIDEATRKRKTKFLGRATKTEITVIPTGGTIASVVGSDRVRRPDQTQNTPMVEIAERIHGIKINVVETGINVDSSEMTWSQRFEIARLVAIHCSKGPVKVPHGTGTGDLSCAVTAIGCCEVVRYPVIFESANHTLDTVGGDAIGNILTSTIMTYAPYSIVCMVRPGGLIVPSNIDLLYAKWHLKNEEWAHLAKTGAYFAKVELHKIFDEEFKYKSGYSLNPNLLAKEELIKFNERYKDTTLDTDDNIYFGIRGAVPFIKIIGFRRRKVNIRSHTRDGDSLLDLKSLRFDGVINTVQDIDNIIQEGLERKILVGKIIGYLVLCENILRNPANFESFKENKKEIKEEYWTSVLRTLLMELFISDDEIAGAVIKFWKAFSGRPNLNFDLNEPAIVNAKENPNDAYERIKFIHQKRGINGVILECTETCGLRINEFRPFLEYCRESNISVVAIPEYGQCTDFRYGSGREMFEKDYVFFGGTWGRDLVIPRIMILSGNKDFLHGLVQTLDIKDTEKFNITRLVQRQLLSSPYFASFEEGEVSDREREQTRYHRESRVDLLFSMHCKKAILAAFLHYVLAFEYNSKLDREKFISFLGLESKK